jgi:hypothetical protein
MVSLFAPLKVRHPAEAGLLIWQVKSREQIDLIWNDGFTGVIVELRREGKELRGWAHPHSDAPTIIERTAQVTAQRIACANK